MVDIIGGGAIADYMVAAVIVLGGGRQLSAVPTLDLVSWCRCSHQRRATLRGAIWRERVAKTSDSIQLLDINARLYGNPFKVHQIVHLLFGIMFILPLL